MWIFRQCRRLAVVLGPLLVLAAGCSQAPRINSHRPVNAILVDGRDVDWGDRRYVLEKLNVTIAVANDADNLYVCIATSDRDVQMQLVRRGIELWLDPRGGMKDYFGVRIPGANHEDLRAMAGGSGGGGRPRGAGGHRDDIMLLNPLSPERLAELLIDMARARQIHILDAPGEQGLQISPSADDPIQARIGFDQGRLVYEARVPLQYVGHPAYAAKDRIGLALRLPAMAARPNLGDPGGPDAFGGGGGPGGGLDGGFGGEGRDGGRGERRTRGRGPGAEWMADVEQWVQVQLQRQ
ncbi:MAG: hypothetical protein O2782_22695 [bacterium]|nr:hypothetical protein [bacterium]